MVDFAAAAAAADSDTAALVVQHCVEPGTCDHQLQVILTMCQ